MQALSIKYRISPMLFNSFEFAVFFPIVTLLYFVLPHSMRWLLLLIASCYFYMAAIPVYILVLFILIGIDYVAGIFIEQSSGKRRKLYLIISLISNLSVLALFKYFNFFNANIAALAKLLNWNYPVRALELILPIGLSFHTFQAMSYTIEVYRGQQKAERHLGIYALYVMFYPQLVAGPIERPQNLIHQFHEKHTFDAIRVSDGLKLMLWGLFKKIVIADRLAILVNHVYDSPLDKPGAILLLGTVFFAFQIYCDFSGYADIAIGSAQVMGFKLMDNFNRPYAARSIAEFWKRWHISLSTWFKDYLYIPLGGNRVAQPRLYFNLLITFLISGLWHGANWTYVVWGALNGFYLAMSMTTVHIRKKITDALGFDRRPTLHKWVKVSSTFSLICFAWIFFRANSISEALMIIQRIFLDFGKSINPTYLRYDVFTLKNMGFYKTDLLLALVSIALMEFIHKIQTHGSIRHMLRQYNIFIRWGLYYAMILSIVFCGVFKYTPFIYFQF